MDARFAERIRFSPDEGIADIDFSGFEFTSTDLVNAFYDAIDAAVMATGRQWYFLVNNHDTRIWPEAWVAFAHRGKKVAVNFALATVRYAEGEGEAVSSDPTLLSSRDEALAQVAKMKTQRR